MWVRDRWPANIARAILSLLATTYPRRTSLRFVILTLSCRLSVSWLDLYSCEGAFCAVAIEGMTRGLNEYQHE